MPDATGLELLAKELGDATLETTYFREQATLVIDPARVRSVLQSLRGRRTDFVNRGHLSAFRATAAQCSAEVERKMARKREAFL